MRLSRLVRRLLLVVDYVLRVLRKIIVCVDSIEGDLASRRLFCALCYSLQRSTQTPDPVNLVGHLSLRGMRSSSASQATRAGNVRRMSSSGCRSATEVAYTVPVWRTDLARSRFPRRFVSNRHLVDGFPLEARRVSQMEPCPPPAARDGPGLFFSTSLYRPSLSSASGCSRSICLMKNGVLPTVLTTTAGSTRFGSNITERSGPPTSARSCTIIGLAGSSPRCCAVRNSIRLAAVRVGCVIVRGKARLVTGVRGR